MSLGNIIQTFQQRQRNQKLDDMINNAMDRNCREGEILTDEKILKISTEIASEFVRMSYRLPSTETLDLNNIE